MRKGLNYYAIVFTPILLIINLGLGSQNNPIIITGFPLNQVVNWIVIFGVSVIVKNSFRSSLWPILIILGVIFSKFTSIAMGKPLSIEMVYRQLGLSLIRLASMISWITNRYVSVIRCWLSDIRFRRADHLL